MPAEPLVTCIMPTFNRRRFVTHGIGCFLRQDYPNLELLVLDDGSEAVADVVPADRRVRYVRMANRQELGAKRNTACELAAGDVIVHWDDDDWSADSRVSVQVQALVCGSADVCGLNRILFYEPATDRAWEYEYPAEVRPWVYGATLCYTKAFWRGNPFPDVQVGEDTRFVWSNCTRRMVVLDEHRLFVATIHRGNTCPKQVGDPHWRSRPVADVRLVIGGDRWTSYRRAVRRGA